MAMSSEKFNPTKIKDAEYRALAEFRHHIRRYLEFSDNAAISAGLEPKQYQLLLALKGLGEGVDPTIGNLAENLCIRHHSAVELVDRAENNGLVERSRSGSNRSFVFLELTPRGQKMLAEAVAQRLQELRLAGPVLVDALKRLVGGKAASKGKRK